MLTGEAQDKLENVTCFLYLCVSVALKQSRLAVISVLLTFFFVWASKYKINSASVVASLQGALEAVVRMYVCGGGGSRGEI